MAASDGAGNARARAEEMLLWQLGRLGRAMARTGVRRLPDELLDGETLDVVGVGQVPRDGDGSIIQNAEFAVLAATDRRFLIVTSLGAETLAYSAITSVSVEYRRSGACLTLAADGRVREFGSITPTLQRAKELAAVIEERRSAQA